MKGPNMYVNAAASVPDVAISDYKKKKIYDGKWLSAPFTSHSFSKLVSYVRIEK